MDDGRWWNFAENQAMEWIVSLTGLPEGAFGVFTPGGTGANLSAIVTAREFWRSKNPENKIKGLIITSGGAHSSVITMAKLQIPMFTLFTKKKN